MNNNNFFFFFLRNKEECVLRCVAWTSGFAGLTELQLLVNLLVLLPSQKTKSCTHVLLWQIPWKKKNKKNRTKKKIENVHNSLNPLHKNFKGCICLSVFIIFKLHNFLSNNNLKKKKKEATIVKIKDFW